MYLIALLSQTPLKSAGKSSLVPAKPARSELEFTAEFTLLNPELNETAKTAAQTRTAATAATPFLLVLFCSAAGATVP